MTTAIKNSINNLKSDLEVKALDRCNYVVFSTDHVVKCENQQLEVAIKCDYPTQFTKSTAEEIAKDFNAYTGDGKKIEFKAMFVADYKLQRIVELEQVLSLLETI